MTRRAPLEDQFSRLVDEIQHEKASASRDLLSGKWKTLDEGKSLSAKVVLCAKLLDAAGEISGQRIDNEGVDL